MEINQNQGKTIRIKQKEAIITSKKDGRRISKAIIS